jgi:glycosyltransferase involved in cell wall biosynthesis
MNAAHEGPAETPRVSVIIIFLNGEAFIEEAIESVLNQRFRSFELILVDDGSTDSSSAIGRRYAYAEPDRIRYTEHRDHANLGMSASRNAGIAIARGELIAFIDADDVWSPDKLLDQVSIFDSHPQVGLVAGATLYWNSWNGGEDYTVLVGNIQNRVLEPPTALLSLYPLGTAPAPCPSSLMARRSVVDSVGGFEASYVGRLQMYEDQAFLAKVYLNTQIYFSDRTWIKYRQHDSSCMAQVIKAGHYDAVRQHFLTWFAHYCRNVGFTDRRVWRKLRRAEWPYRHPRLHRASGALDKAIRKVGRKARRLGLPLRRWVFR